MQLLIVGFAGCSAVSGRADDSANLANSRPVLDLEFLQEQFEQPAEL